MEKKLPMRMCTGCSEMKPKRELLRIVRDKEGNISLDLKGKASGRGAYICNSKQCFEKALKTKRIERQLSVQLPQEIILQIEAELDA